MFYQQLFIARSNELLSYYYNLPIVKCRVPIIYKCIHFIQTQVVSNLLLVGFIKQLNFRLYIKGLPKFKCLHCVLVNLMNSLQGFMLYALQGPPLCVCTFEQEE